MIVPMAQTGHVATLLVPVVRPDVGWELSEETMPESELHAHAVDLLRALLRHWAESSGARIVWNLAVRWVERDARIGVDPDVAVLLPPPPVEEKSLTSLRTWLPGHAAPALAIEVVSESNPNKDYAVAPAKYAASGTKELWVFDPLLVGPKIFGGPFRIQVYRRDDAGTFARLYAGDGPAYSPALRAWAIPTDEGRMLRVADDESATKFWLTREEAALARVAELEAQLARKPPSR